MNLQELKRKYSFQQIPEWELKALEQPAQAEEAQKPRRGRPPKPVEADGNGN